jgi:hypothetical protein
MDGRNESVELSCGILSLCWVEEIVESVKTYSEFLRIGAVITPSLNLSPIYGACSSYIIDDEEANTPSRSPNESDPKNLSCRSLFPPTRSLRLTAAVISTPTLKYQPLTPPTRCEIPPPMT